MAGEPTQESKRPTVVVHIDRELAERVKARFSDETGAELNIRQTVERALKLADKRSDTNTGTFRLIGFDEGGEKVGPKGAHRLVCNIEGGGKIAIWGSKDSRRNIDLVLNAAKKADLPKGDIRIECKYRPPEPSRAKRYGHTHWVPENCHLRILEG